MITDRHTSYHLTADRKFHMVAYHRAVFLETFVANHYTRIGNTTITHRIAVYNHPASCYMGNTKPPTDHVGTNADIISYSTSVMTVSVIEATDIIENTSTL